MIDWENMLFQSIGLSRISRIIPQIPDITPSPIKGALINIMLPSFHYLEIVTVLDEALTEYIVSKNIHWPKNKKRDLFNRINLVSIILPIINADQLQSIRERRNAFAHEPRLVFTNPITWDEYNLAEECICKAMKEMNFIKDIPNISAFFQRNPALYLDELGPEGEVIRHEFIIGANLNETAFMEFKQGISYFPPTKT